MPCRGLCPSTFPPPTSGIPTTERSPGWGVSLVWSWSGGHLGPAVMDHLDVLGKCPALSSLTTLLLVLSCYTPAAKPGAWVQPCVS